MTLQTLRNQVRDLLSEDAENLPDATLNDLIERASQRIESDYTKDTNVTPRQMIVSTSGTITSTGFPLPSDWLRARVVRIGDYILRYVSPEMVPVVSEQQDATVEIYYVRTIPKLVNDTDTNWLLDLAARVYLYATAVEYCYWNDEEETTRQRYLNAYGEARDGTGRANSPRPVGGWKRGISNQRGHYTIVGSNMVFRAIF